MTKLNYNELLVLRFLSGQVEYYTGSPAYYSFAGIMDGTSDDFGATLSRKEVRRACRSLKRRGFTEFLSGLWNDYGPAGAGYSATRAGIAYIKEVASPSCLTVQLPSKARRGSVVAS